MPGSDQAGPSSRPADSDLSLCTFRELYELLESSRSDRPVGEIQKLVEARLPDLLRCGSSASPSAAISKGSLDADVVKLGGGLELSIDADQREICQRISERYQIEELVALLAFKRFLQTETFHLDILNATSGNKGRKVKESLSRDLVEEILDSFNVFYFEEQIYTIRCITSLLRIAEDTFHQYYDIAQGALSSIGTQDFGDSCLNRFVDLSRESLPTSIRDSPRYSPFWAKHGLKQQLAILEVVFLIFYGHANPSAAFAVRVLKVLDHTRYGQNQANEAFFDSQSMELLPCIRFTLTFIAVEALDLERTMDGYDFLLGTNVASGEDRTPQALISDANQLDEVLSLLESTSADPDLSPIFLGWALVLRKTEEALTDALDKSSGRLPSRLQALREALTPGDGGEPIWTRLASAALAASMGLFPTLNAMVQSPLISPNHSLSASFEISVATSLAYRAVFKGLLLTITEVIRPEYITNQDDLIGLWEATFSEGRGSSGATSNALGISALCLQFWEVDYEKETRRAVVEMAKRRWPVQFRPFVRLLKALTGVCAGDALATKAAVSSTEEVLQQLYELPTLAHALLSTVGVVRPPWEVIESSDYAVLDYRCIRTIPVFGSRLAIQPGTCGRMISEAGQQPTVVLWDLPQPLSGWQILCDVLASFVRLLDGPTAVTPPLDKDDIFNQPRDHTSDFSSLSPGETDDAMVAAEIIELFSAVLAGAPAQADALLTHLEANMTQNLDPDQSTGSEFRITQPSLVVIIQRILDQALNARDIPSRLVSASYTLLGLLLSLRPSEVWLAIRSSNLVIGSGGQAPISSGVDSTITSALLAYECSTSNFQGIRSLLSFHTKLIAEVQRSQFIVTAELSRIKVDTLLRTMNWVCESVWPEFQSWQYKTPSEKVYITSLSLTLLETVITDHALRGRAAGATRDLSNAMDNLLVVHASSLYIAPLISIIGTGQALLDTLQRSGNHGDAEHAHGMILSSLRLATAIILRRQELSRNGRYPHQPCLLERLIFDTSQVAVRAVSIYQKRSTRVQLLSAIIAYTQQALSVALCRQAGLLMTVICLSAEEHKDDSASSGALYIIGHLGSTAEVNTTVRGLVNVLDNSHFDVESRRVIWTMAAAMVTTQPGMAGLLLGSPRLDDEKDENSEIRQTALSVAIDSVHIWETLWEHDPALLDAILLFLGSAWARIEYLPGLQAKTDAKFWEAITSIIAAESGSIPEEPAGFEEVDGRLKTDSDEEVKLFSHRMLSKARSLNLLSIDLQIPRAKDAQASGVDSVLKLIMSPTSLTSSLESAMKVDCNTSLHVDVESKLGIAFPEIHLNSLRRAAKHNNFDLTRNYGDDYVFDIELFRTRLEGFCSGSERSTEANDDTVVDDRVIQQAILLLSSVNLDWSVIDSQTMYLRAWHQLLEKLPRAARWELRGSIQREKEMRSSCLKAWVTCAKVTARESRDGAVMLGIHAARVGLLEALLEAAWGGPVSQGSPQSQKAGVEMMSSVLEQTQKMLSHPVFSLEASVRGPDGPSFHTGLFSIAILCSRQARRVVTLEGQAQSASAQIETHRVIHQAIDSFTSHSIRCLRIIVDDAILLLATRSSDALALSSREEDLTLVCSLLELLIRPGVSLSPHQWLSQCQAVSLLPACVSLLRRAPLRPSDQGAITQAAYFMPALLSFFLALASQQESAEQVVIAGLMTALASNALSPALEAGAPAAVLPSGAAGPAHACWVTMVRLVVSIVENLDGDVSATWAAASVRFIETEVVGFVRLYGAQLGRALSFSPLAARGRGNARDGEPLRFVEQDARITQPQLNELQATMRLFLVMASADGFAQGSGREVMTTFAERTSTILQQLVYLTERPHQLASLLLHGGGEASSETSKEDTEYEQQVVEQMTSIATTAVAALWHQTRGADILSRGVNSIGDSKEKALLRPTMRTAPGEPASIGTLLDLAAHCIEILQRKPTPSSDKISSTQVALEQTLALAVTQLTLNSSFSVGSPNHQAVESGIQRDVAACVQSALGAVRGVGMGQEEGEGGGGDQFLSHLSSLCEQT